jgi:IclR family pca regulon transcriptional regulator
MTDRKRKTSSEHPAVEDSPSISKSLVRGLAILTCFTAEHPLLGISEIAAQLRGSRSTTHRYACTLVELGYLEQDSKRRYHLGLRAADIGISAIGSLALSRQSRPHLELLRDRTAHTVSLAILDRAEILVIERLPAHRSMLEQLDLPIGQGSRLPAHCTATGKLLLALANPTAPLRLPAELKLTRHGPRSITAKQALCTELEQIRSTALACEDEEFSDGARSLAAPIYDLDGRATAAVALSLPSSVCAAGELRGRFAGAVAEAAGRISAEAGRALAP